MSIFTRKLAKIGLYSVLVLSIFMIGFNMWDTIFGISQYPLFGVYGSIGVLFWALMIVIDNFKRSGIIIYPDESYKAFSLLTEIFSTSRDFIKFIDPYINGRSLRALDAAPKGIKIQVLTTPYVKGEDLESVKIQVKELMRERPELEIRSDVSKKDNRVVIHDPCILTSPTGWKLGSSTNFIGNKQTSIDPMSPNETEELTRWFDEEWEKSYDFV